MARLGRLPHLVAWQPVEERTARVSISSVRRVRLLLIAGVMTCVEAVGAQITVPIPLPELVRRADRIVLAEVVRTAEQKVESRTGLPFYRVQLILEGGTPWKGSWPEMVTWDTFAGAVGLLREGDVILAFLATQGEGELIDPLGPSGLFVVRAEPCEPEQRECRVAVNALNNTGLWRGSLLRALTGKVDPTDADLWMAWQSFETHIEHKEGVRSVFRAYGLSSTRGPVPLELIRETVSFLRSSR